MKNKSARLILYTVVGLILPVLLIHLDVIPFEHRELVLVAVVFITMLGIYTEKMSSYELGIRSDNLRSALRPYFLFTLFSAALILWYAQISGKSPVEDWWKIPYFQFAFIPTSIVQELIYRAFFQTQYQKILKPATSILLIAAIYSFMHILWNSEEFIIMTLIGGLVWGFLWHKHPNLLWISLSHTILNFLINYFGYLKIDGS